jgi:acyl-CoA thioesterase FadM
MVLRALWNIGAGLVHRVANKRSASKGLLGVTYPSVWKGRTGLLDCDVNLHLNNSSYLYSMELARWHLTAYVAASVSSSTSYFCRRQLVLTFFPFYCCQLGFCSANGALWQAIKNRRMIMVASQAIRYRHAIPPFHAYQIKTQVVFWDDHWIYMLHQVEDPDTGKQFAEGLVRGVFMKGRRRVSPNRILAEVSDGGMIDPPTEMPEVVKGFLNWDGACNASMGVAEKVAKEELESNPPAATPEKLGARIWQEMKKSMNLP